MGDEKSETFAPPTYARAVPIDIALAACVTRLPRHPGRWYVLAMRLRPADTTEEAWAVLEEGLRKMTPAQRVRRCIDLTILTHRLALAEIKRRHPDEDERTHRLRLAARILDANVMNAAFGFVDDRR
jgi:hypothetical protein